MRIEGIALVLALLGVGGCRASRDALMVRAPEDLSCPKAQLQVREVPGTSGHGETVIVEGCGRRQTYVGVCNGTDLGSTCTWLRDGAVTTIPGPG